MFEMDNVEEVDGYSFRITWEDSNHCDRATRPWTYLGELDRSAIEQAVRSISEELTEEWSSERGMRNFSVPPDLDIRINDELFSHTELTRQYTLWGAPIKIRRPREAVSAFAAGPYDEYDDPHEQGVED